MKTQQELLKQVQEIVSQCDRCGTCLTVCPLYGVKDVEVSSARGKNNLALGLLLGVVKPTPEVQEAMNFCLLCRTCVDNCPTKVQTDEAMMAVRQYLADTSGNFTASIQFAMASFAISAAVAFFLPLTATSKAAVAQAQEAAKVTA